MTASIGPTVRRRRLGTELRRLRETHSIKLEEVADKLGLAASYNDNRRVLAAIRYLES